MKPYMYYFIRQDISHAQKCVQISHLSFELSKTVNLNIHPSAVVVKIKNETGLLKQISYLENCGFTVIQFKEPLLNNELTGLAVIATTPEHRNCLKKFQLLKNEDFSSPSNKTQETCKHKKTKLVMVETLAFSYEPQRKCTGCGETLKRSNALSSQEKKQALRSSFSFMEQEWLDEKENLLLKNGGFNESSIK